MTRKIITLLIGFCLIFEQSGFAQVGAQLVLPAFAGGLTCADTFRPEHLRSMSYDPLENNFRTLLDKGSAKVSDPLKLENSTRQLFKYFFTGLCLPNDSFWVNLRPDSPDNIIDESLAETEIGKVMLEADVRLKKDTARYTAPDTIEGRAYWDKLYYKAQELFGDQNITIPTLTRPWIVPDEIILRQSENNVYIYKATLKVMLEADHLQDAPEYSFNDPRLKELNDYSSQLIRELILPKLTRDVNTSRRYASLRQVYFSLILAQWFKNKPQEEYGPLFSKIDSRDLRGLTSQAPWTKDTYFQEYRKSFKNGEYNQRENIQTGQGISLRQYFSGGVRFGKLIQDILPVDLVKGKESIRLLLANTRETLVRIAYDPFKIEYIAEALQSGGLLTVKGNKNLPPGASAFSSKDGGKEKPEGSPEPTIITIRSLEELLAVLEQAPENSVLYIDIDDTLFYHFGVYPSQKFAARRMEMKRKSMSAEEFRRNEQEILSEIIQECVHMEELGIKAGVFKIVPGVDKLLEKAKEKKIRVVVITNRPEKLRIVTEEILDNLKIRGYEKIYFAGFGNGKAQEVQEEIRELNPQEVFFVDNDRGNVELFARQLGNARLQAFHLDSVDDRKEYVQSYYLGELKKLLSGGLESSEKRAMAELLLVSAVMNISELEGEMQKSRLKDLRMTIQEFRPSHRKFFEMVNIGKYLEEFSVQVMDSKAEDIKGYIRERTHKADPEQVDLSSDSAPEAALKIVKAARDSRAVALTPGYITADHWKVFYAIQKFVKVAREIKKLLPEEGPKDLDYYLQELFKNAFYHGNKLDLDLPVYFYFSLDKNGNVESIEVYDNGAREFKSMLDMYSLREKEIVGKGLGVQDIVMDGWEYERFKFNNFPGSAVRVRLDKRSGDHLPAAGFAQKDGGLKELFMISDYSKTSGMNPEALYFRSILALNRERAVEELKLRYPKLKDNHELLGDIYDYLMLLPDNSLKISDKLSAASERLMRSFAREPLFLDELLSWERSRDEGENILLRICMRSLMTTLFSLIEHFRPEYGLYYNQMRLIHEASLIIPTKDRSTNSDYLVDTEFLGDLKEFYAAERADSQSSALFIQVLMHEFGHNILENIISSRSTLIGQPNVRRLGLLFWSNTSFSLKRMEEFFAEATALKLSNELGFNSQEYVEFFKSFYEKKGEIDDPTKRHLIPRYLFFEWYKTGVLQNVINGLQLSRMEESVKEMIPPSTDWLDIFAVEDRRLLWEFLLKLEVFRPEEYRRLKEGFNEWYNPPRDPAMAEESGESALAILTEVSPALRGPGGDAGRDGGTAAPGEMKNEVAAGQEANNSRETLTSRLNALWHKVRKPKEERYDFLTTYIGDPKDGLPYDEIIIKMYELHMQKERGKDISSDLEKLKSETAANHALGLPKRVLWRAVITNLFSGNPSEISKGITLLPAVLFGTGYIAAGIPQKQSCFIAKPLLQKKINATNTGEININLCAFLFELAGKGVPAAMAVSSKSEIYLHSNNFDEPTIVHELAHIVSDKLRGDKADVASERLAKLAALLILRNNGRKLAEMIATQEKENGNKIVHDVADIENLSALYEVKTGMKMATFNAAAVKEALRGESPSEIAGLAEEVIRRGNLFKQKQHGDLFIEDIKECIEKAAYLGDIFMETGVKDELEKSLSDPLFLPSSRYNLLMHQAYFYCLKAAQAGRKEEALRLIREVIVFYNQGNESASQALLETMKMNDLSADTLSAERVIKINNSLKNQKVPLLLGYFVAAWIQFMGNMQPALEQRDGGTAAPGGIDLRSLPIKAETQVSLPAAVSSKKTRDPRLDAQWRDILELANRGFLPESGRIKECLFYYRANGVLPDRIESMLACLAEILRKEEDLYLPTDPTLKEFLVLLESS